MESMQFLYRVMEELSNAGIPIVFKGAMVLNLVLRGNNPSKVERMTRDIDGDWVGEFPTMKEMENALREAVKAAYEKMKGIKNKPDFFEVYHRVNDVIGKISI